MPSHQFSLALIDRRHASAIIKQRSGDGYINATELCNAAGKHWWNWRGIEPTGHFLRALSAQRKLPLNELVQEVLEADGTTSMWVHPHAAINLGQWLSGDFAVKVAEWVHEWLDGKGPPRQPAANMPYHVQRHMLNEAKVPSTHFSILQEMTFTLIAPMELQGYTLPEHLVPDISQGLMFCKFLREMLGVNTAQLPMYEHEYPDGRMVPAKLYPIEHLPAFRRFVGETWMPERSADYFKDRDPLALPYLDQVLKLKSESPKMLPPGSKPRYGAANRVVKKKRA